MHTQLMQCIFNVSVYTVYVPVNVFQSCGDDFLPTYLTNTKKRIKCLASDFAESRTILKPTPYIFTLVQKVKRRVLKIHVF